jgi:hypothetical protein
MNTKSKYAIYKVVFETDKKKPCRMYINSEKQNLVASFYDDPETVAMFQLFAAAPDMLEALEYTRSTMSDVCTLNGCTCKEYGWQHDDPKAIAMIDAAIAKAGGGANE